MGVEMGDTGGEGPGPLAIFGVLKRHELDLRPVVDLAAIGACAWIAQLALGGFAVRPVPALISLALVGGSLYDTVYEAVALEADPALVPADQRAYMLALYPFVDQVVLFDDDTPLRLIEAIRPDILVKGSDYTPETVVGRDVVESYGGKVVFLPLVPSFSTTELLRRIRELPS